MPRRRWITPLMIAIALLVAWTSGPAAQSRPADEVVWAWHVTIAPGWFDPADAPAQITPFGGYPDIDELFVQQAKERDRAKREALLHRIQQLTVARVMFAPVMDLRGLIGIGSRVAEHTINSIPLHPGPALEDFQLKVQ